MSEKRERKGQDVAAILLARGFTRARAAKAAGVAEKTVYKWLHDPSFKLKVEKARNDFRDAIVGRLVALSTKAVTRLEELLDSDSDAIRLGAIREWQKCALDLGNQYDLAKRIEELRETNFGLPEPPTEPDQ